MPTVGIFTQASRLRINPLAATYLAATPGLKSVRAERRQLNSQQQLIHPEAKAIAAPYKPCK